MTLPRWLHRLYARLSGFFWLPCPLCGVEFGGHEWRHVGGHLSDIPTGEPYSGRAICPACTAKGLGCRAWADAELVKQYAGACDCDLWPKGDR